MGKEGDDGRGGFYHKESIPTIPVRVSTPCVILAEWVQGWSVCHMMIPTKLLKRKWAALGGSIGNTCNTTCSGKRISACVVGNDRKQKRKISPTYSTEL